MRNFMYAARSLRRTQTVIGVVADVRAHGLVALLAAVVPARRAARVDPAVALRAD